jgi:hypothetical protein
VRPSYTLTPLGSLASDQTVALVDLTGLELPLPTCYETTVQSLICLGWLHNNSPDFVSDISIVGYLLNEEGKPFNILETTSPLSILAPQTSSPYRIVFPQVPSEPWFIYMDLHHVKRIARAENTEGLVADLSIVDLQIHWEDEHYQISGRILKDDNYPLNEIRVIATIEDEHGNMSGFRVLDISQSATLGQDTMTFKLDVSPLNRTLGEVTVVAQGYIIQR